MIDLGPIFFKFNYPLDSLILNTNPEVGYSWYHPDDQITGKWFKTQKDAINDAPKGSTILEKVIRQTIIAKT
jgi:hypothetical protein